MNERSCIQGECAMLHPIVSLREAARLLSEGAPLPPPLAEWVSEALKAFLEQRSSLDEAFGLHWGRGGVPWWMDEAIRVRDGALRELAVALAPTGSITARARVVRTRTLRYATTRW